MPKVEGLLTKREERELIEAAQRGDIVARNALIDRNIRLCWKRIHKNSLPLPPTINREELLGEAVIGLDHAISKFDLRRDTRFSTYATWWINQTINRYIEKNYYQRTTPVRVFRLLGKIDKISDRILAEENREPTDEELLEELGCSENILNAARGARSFCVDLDETGSNENGVSLVEKIDTGVRFEKDVEIEVCLSNCLPLLPQRLRYILECIYGINDSRVYTLEEVGEELGVSKQKVKQLKDEALIKLREIIKDGYGEEAGDLLAV